jgi:hypothetical protein
MNINERMEANAIIERMTEHDDGHFDRTEAERLISLIPVDRNAPKVTAQFSRMKRSDSAEGYAAGIGNVSMQDDKQERVDTVLIGGEKVWRVGGYEVEHKPGVMTIRKMWARNELIGAEQEAILDYRRKAMVLRQKRRHEISFFIFGFAYATWPIWKTAR